MYYCTELNITSIHIATSVLSACVPTHCYFLIYGWLVEEEFNLRCMCLTAVLQTAVRRESAEINCVSGLKERRKQVYASQ
jgi:hypothetical protein